MGDHGTHGSKRATQIDANDSVDTRISMNLRKNNANDRGGAVETIPHPLGMSVEFWFSLMCPLLR